MGCAAGNGANEPRRHYRTPMPLPFIGGAASLYLVTPLSGRPSQQYVLAAILIGSGVVLSMATQLVRRGRPLEVDEVAPIGVAPS
jgi:basic amino acid/polyamine antiporter, APA family